MRSLLSLYRTLSMRYLGKRRNRAGLIVLSIALGVAMLVSTQLINQCIDAAVAESTAPGAELADLVVTSNRRVKLELAPVLRKIPGVKSAQPLIFERVVLPEFNNRTAVLIGLDLAGGKAADNNPFGARLDVTNPLAIASGSGVAIGAELAQVLDPGGKPTKAFTIRAGGSTHTLMPVGTVHLEGKAAKLGGFLLVMEVSQAARVIGQEGIAERIDLKLEPGANLREVKHAAEAAIAGQAEVQTPERVNKGSQEIVGGLRIGPTLCGIGAMVVGLFLVYNALAVSVAERRHDIGVLRSMGATRSQIALLFTGEALLLGIIGALLGVPVGMGLARVTFHLVRQEMAQLFLTANQPLELTLQTFLLAVLTGMTTAVLAALVPAMSAASDEPADAVRRAPSGATRFFRTLQAAGSALLISAGFSVVLIREYLPRRVGGYGGMVFLLIGLLLSVPLMVGLMSRLLQPLARRIFGIEARLAADNLLRAPGRTGVVVGALAAGVSLMLQTAGIGRSNEKPILDWLDRAVSADLFIVCGDPTSASSAALPMRPDVEKQLRELPGVEHTMSVRYYLPEFNGRLVWMTALDAQAYHDSNRHASQLPHLHLFPKLAEPNTCLISENFAALHKVGAGETISIRGPNGPVALKVLGIVQEYAWSRGSIIVDRGFYADAFNDHLIDSVHVFLRSDGEVEARRRVKLFCDANALAVLTRSEIDSYLVNMIRRIYMLAYLQQIAVGIVAALGVVMALLISVLQRQRELGLMRAVGATQGQVLKTVLAEATLMGVFGTLLGIIAGVPLEWYLLRVVIFEETGFTFPLMVPWKETLILSYVAIATATVAGLVPAVHAVRLRIAEAIAYE